MKTLVVGAGVIGTAYAWKLSESGNDVTLLVRKGKGQLIAQDGIHICYRDERKKEKKPTEIVFHPQITEEVLPEAGFELIIVSVRAHQLEDVLPLLAKYSGDAVILFFGNNWWGDEKIKKYLAAGQYLFGFSRLIGG